MYVLYYLIVFYFIDLFIGLLRSHFYLFVKFELWALIKLIDELPLLLFLFLLVLVLLVLLLDL